MASRRIVGAALAAILAIAALGGCSAHNVSGPFEQDDTIPGQQCIPLAGHTVATDGLEAVRNRATTTGVIDKVTLARSKGLRLLRVWAVPTDGQLYGVGFGYPPPTWPLHAWHWDMRLPADGARVPPSKGHFDRTNLLLVVRLAAGARRGRAIGVDIWYHVGENHYHQRTATALVLVQGQSC